jgi:ferredoxin
MSTLVPWTETDEANLALPFRGREPDGTHPLLVRVSPGLCEGWGECRKAAPEVYELDGDGRVAHHRFEVPPELAVEAWRGARRCPKTAIQCVEHTDGDE